MWLAVCAVSPILCLFKALFEGEAISFVLYSSPNAILFRKALKLGYHVCLFKTHMACARILVMELEAGKPAHLAY